MEYTCQYCDRASPNAQGLSAHERWCEKNPNKLVPKPKVERTPAVRKPSQRSRTRLNSFVQEQNIETATAYVLAAKWPKGIPVEDMPRVIRLVKAVEHG